MKTILIIENDSALLDSYSEVIKRSGYDTMIAYNGDMGINYAINRLPDLILCNTQLPNIDGYGVLSVLSTNPLTIKIPFIFLNSASQPNEVRKGMDMGADDFVTKPFRDNQLMRSIEARINKINQNLTMLSEQEAKIPHLGYSRGLEKLLELIAQSKVRHLKKKQTLYYEGDYPQGLYLLATGCIKTLRLTNDGRQLITGLYKPNDFIGLDTLLLDSPFTESAETTENSSVHLIPKKIVMDLLNEHIELNQHFIKLLSINIHEKEDQLVELAYEPVRKRLAHVLVRLIKDVFPLDIIDISREELAGLAGIATETVSRILSDFKEKGLIKKTGSQIQIIDLDSLISMKGQ